MAKSNMAKLVELHLEKAVLGLCAVLLVFAVGHWTISSPRAFTPAAGSPVMAPSEVDKYLMDKSRGFVEKVGRTDVPEDVARSREAQPDPEWDKVIQSSRQFRAGIIDKPSFGEPGYAKVRPAGAPPPSRVTLEEFVKLIPAPAAPRIVSDTVLVRTDKPGDVAVNGATSAYPFKELVENWKKIDFTVAKVPVRVDVEAEETAADGTVAVKPIEPMVRKVAAIKADPKDPGVLPAIPDFIPGKNQGEVFTKINECNSELCQRRILTPDLPDIWDASRDSWVSGAEILRGILPEDILPSLPVRRILPPAPVRPAPVAPTAKPAPAVPAGKSAGVGARTAGAAPTAKHVGPAAPAVPPKAVGDAPFEPVREAEGSSPYAAAGRTHGPGPGGEVGGIVSPVLSSRLGAEKIFLWWLHGNAKPGSVYRYRVRIAFINPLLARDALAKNVEESKIKFVESPWSAWSEPVAVVRPIRFFLINKVTEGQVRVAVFARAMGRWTRRDYTVSQGDPIGRPEPQQKVWNPLTGKEQEVTVDFSTGTVAMDFAETAVVLPSGKSAVGVEMIYLDDDGKLKSQVSVSSDRASAAAKDYDALDKQTQPENKRPAMGPPAP